MEAEGKAAIWTSLPTAPGVGEGPARPNTLGTLPKRSTTPGHRCPGSPVSNSHVTCCPPRRALSAWRRGVYLAPTPRPPQASLRAGLFSPKLTQTAAGPAAGLGCPGISGLSKHPGLAISMRLTLPWAAGRSGGTRPPAPWLLLLSGAGEPPDSGRGRKGSSPVCLKRHFGVLWPGVLN